MEKPILLASEIYKIYQRGSEKVTALNGINLKINRGDFITFMGPSGSGKTTLFNILGCLDNPTSGKIIVGGKPVFSDNDTLSESRLTRIRRKYFGYIFQKFYLIPTLSLLENVMLPFAFSGEKNIDAAIGVLKKLGLGDRMSHRPAEVSGGEMQRAAIARALVNRPQILLADEPTGNLDSLRSEEIGEILFSLNHEDGLTILLVTHNISLAKRASSIVEIRDGSLVNER